MTDHRTFAFALSLAGLLAAGGLVLTGCGSGRPATAKVTGKVTLAGQPVPQGTITFYPQTGRPATGRLQSDGTYTLTTFDPGDGALVGKHTVTVEAVKFSGVEPPKSVEEEMKQGKGLSSSRTPPQSERLVPPRYAQRDASGLTAEVKPGPNTFDFDLRGP
jgi:hypothetical protein